MITGAPLISIIKDVCAVVGVQIPSSVFTNISSNRTMSEMLSLANEMAKRIAFDTHEWTNLRSTANFAGNGVKVAFDLPSNYKRMLLTSNVWRSTNDLSPMRFVPDMDEWLNRRSRNIYDPYGEWTLLGALTSSNQINIQPAMGTGVSAYFTYLTKSCISLASGGIGEQFTSDNDVFLLDDRLLKLAMIWQWKAQKGSPYNEDLASYETALGFNVKNDSPAPILIGRRSISSNARIAYPFPVPIP